MGYSKEIYTAAAAALESRGKETRRKLQHNKSVAMRRCPRWKTPNAAWPPSEAI